MWKSSGHARVKSFKLYQELEAEYAKALTEIERLRGELERKDRLVRQMAAELAESASTRVQAWVPQESTLPMPFSEVATKRPVAPTVAPPTAPVEGNGEETTIEDELGHIRTTPKGTKAKKQ